MHGTHTKKGKRTSPLFLVQSKHTQKSKAMGLMKFEKAFGLETSVRDDY